MPPGQQIKVHKSTSFVDILEVSKFTTFCDRKGYRKKCLRPFVHGCHGNAEIHMCTKFYLHALYGVQV